MRSCPMKPLYIHGPEGTRVLLDIPALRVTVPKQADRLFPLQRISRIAVSGPVRWETPALLACADRGISVTFLDEHAEVRARWLGRGGERQALLQRMTDFLALPDALERYQNWRRGVTRMAARSAVRRMNLKNERGSGEEAVLLRQLCADHLFGRLFRHITALLLAEMTQTLADQGLAADCELLQDSWIDLPRDLADVLAWDFVPSLARWILALRKQAQRQEVPVEPAELLRFYAERSQRVDYLCRGLLNKLHRWLLECG